MFKQKSTFRFAFVLGVFLAGSVALSSCNNDGEKAAEPAAETKTDTVAAPPAAAPDTAKPAVMDTAKAKDTTASTKPVKTAP